MWQLIRLGVDGITPGNAHNYVSIVGPHSPALIGIVATYPPCGIDASQQVENKQQSTSLILIRQTQKSDAAVNRKMRDDIDYASIFSKVIGRKLSDGSSCDLYMHCSMNFAVGPVQT